MASSSSNLSQDWAEFHAHIRISKRVLALLGAGISASSGLATFRGKGGLWRNHSATSIATPEAFARDPALVWRFYSYRRHKALQADPNAAHYALAAFARSMPGFLTLSQNVDGLSQRASHPKEQLKLLHGTLFEVRCADAKCGYTSANFDDPIVPSLAIPTTGEDLTTNQALERAKQNRELDISDSSVQIADIPRSELPNCPQCKKALIRPNVVWFGERLPETTLADVERYLDNSRDEIDLIMVIGTSARVFPAAGYIEKARTRGARVCVVNMDANDAPPDGWKEGDWFFQGDAAELVPKLLEPVIGKLEIPPKPCT